MTRFTDGPAAGVTLMLRRTPKLLRVVRGPDGKVDALDQLDDRPAVDEELFVYRLVSNDGHVHLNMRDKKGRRCGGFYSMATYAMVEEQPADDVMRNTQKWQEWAKARAQ